MGKVFAGIVLALNVCGASWAAGAVDSTHAAKTDSAAHPAANSVPVTESSSPAPSSASKPSASASPSESTVVKLDAQAPAITRTPPDFRLFNDPPLIAREYGFGILGSVVAGALGFYIGSGIETAITSESRAHKGTLGFTGLRYDNFYGAFYGGTTGIVLGSAFTTYFIGETDEEEGGLFWTLAGTAAASTGAFYLAHLMGVNDHVGWTPFIPLLTIPSLGGTFGFNVARLFHDKKREAIINHEASVHVQPPRLAWFRDRSGGQGLQVQALNLTF